MLFRYLLVSLFIISSLVSYSQKKGAKKTAPAAKTQKTAEQLKAEEAARLEEENRKKAEAEAERQRKLAEYEAKIKRVIAPDNRNKYSVRPILDKDIMFKKTVWRRMDMKEKQNRNFMAVNRELPSLIIEYVKMGKIKPYETDSLDDGRLMTVDKFNANLADPSYQMPDTVGMSKADKAAIMAQNKDINPKQLTILQLKEDVIFDKKRSRMYYDLIAITIFIPAAINPRGFDQPVVSVKYNELVEALKKDNRAMWFNRENDAEHRNYADAFDLRLFASYIVKVSNPNDELIVDTYGGDAKAGRYGSEKAALDLMEFEHNLWEF